MTPDRLISDLRAMRTGAYSEIQGINWSSLKYMSISPRMYRYRLTNPEPRKKSWVLGGAIHCMVLEPDKFAGRYITLDAETIEAVAPPLLGRSPHQRADWPVHLRERDRLRRRGPELLGHGALPAARDLHAREGPQAAVRLHRRRPNRGDIRAGVP